MKTLTTAFIALSIATLILCAQVMVNARAVRVLRTEMRGLTLAVSSLTNLTLTVDTDGNVTWKEKP